MTRVLARVGLGLGLASLLFASLMIPALRQGSGQVTVSTAWGTRSPTAGMIAIAAEASGRALVRAVSGSILQNGGTITLPVEVTNVQNLGATTVVVGYDPAVLGVAGCQRNSAFDVGLCNTAYDRDEDGVPDAVRFNLIALEGLSSTDGEPLNLANITWVRAGVPVSGTTSTLAVEVSTFTDPDAIPMSVSAENGQITVTVQVRIDYLMAVAAHLGQPAVGGNEIYDAVPDATIDIQDLSTLASRWREMWP